MTQTTILVDGLYFGEGPRWHEGRLWLSDFYDHAVKSVGEAGDLRTELELDDQPSGLGWLPTGQLLLVSMRQRKLRRLEADGLAGAAAREPDRKVAGVAADIAERQIVGDTSAPLIRCVPIVRQLGEYKCVTFKRPYYQPMRKGYISGVEMKICDDKGELVNFKNGRAISIINLRKCGSQE